MQAIEVGYRNFFASALALNQKGVARSYKALAREALREPFRSRACRGRSSSFVAPW